MKEFCVVFDTNVLNDNKNRLNEIKLKIESIADIFIPRIVIEEIEGQKSRVINDDYLKIKSIIEKNSNNFCYDEKFDLSDILKKSECNIKGWFEEYCNKNVIEYMDISLSDIIIRSKYKIAPFINEIGSSDKGFKDSIIWLSILKNKTLENYKKIILVTNDKTAFIKRSDDLYSEYNKEHTNSIVFCSNIDELYDNLNIIKSDNIDNNSEKAEINNVEFGNVQSIKENLNSCVSHIFYNTYMDDWDFIHRDNIFNIYKRMTSEDVECFLNLLEVFLKENIFFNYVDISDLLTRCGIESSGDNVSFEYLNELDSIYKNLKDNNQLYDSLIIFLKTEFNKLYKYKPPHEKNNLEDIVADLPF